MRNSLPKRALSRRPGPQPTRKRHLPRDASELRRHRQRAPPKPGLPQRCDPRSYRDQGVDITPGTHRGTDASAPRRKRHSDRTERPPSHLENAAANCLPEPVRKDARDIISRIRQIERQRASDASADRHRTLIALRAAGRFVASEKTRSRSSGSRASGCAMRFPGAPAPSCFRAGISCHRSAMTNVEGTTRSTFHMAFTNGSDTRLAVAQQAYTDREQASVFSIGNISDDSEESRNFWSDLERRMHRRLGTLRTLPAPARPTGAPTIPRNLRLDSPRLARNPRARTPAQTQFQKGNYILQLTASRTAATAYGSALRDCLAGKVFHPLFNSCRSSRRPSESAANNRIPGSNASDPKAQKTGTKSSSEKQEPNNPQQIHQTSRSIHHPLP